MVSVHKKSMAIMLVICMLISLFPGGAFAEGTAGGGVRIEGGTEGLDYSWDSERKVLSIKSGEGMTLSGSADGLSIVIEDGVRANLTLSGLEIVNQEVTFGSPITLLGTAELNLVLAQDTENLLSVFSRNEYGGVYSYADGIHVPHGAKLTISGSGALTVKSGSHHATIGNGAGDCGEIHISGGTVKAYNYGTRWVSESENSENAYRTGGVAIGAIIPKDAGASDVQSKITISGGAVTAVASQTAIGVVDDSKSKEYANGGYDIRISGGEISAYAVEYRDGFDPMSDEFYQGRSTGIGGESRGKSGKRDITISGGTVKAYGNAIGIGGDFNSDGASGGQPLNITISGGKVETRGMNLGNAIGIGGWMDSGDRRSILISGDAVVSAMENPKVPTVDPSGGFSIYGGDIGGGDNSNSSIVIQDNARITYAKTIGSTLPWGFEGDKGFDGGTIQILGSASVGTETRIFHIGGSDWYGEKVTTGKAGSGGNITINTTGRVDVGGIGGGSGVLGGDGGNITIRNGVILTNHIGGGTGNEVNQSGNPIGIGGSGGNIIISGGQLGSPTYGLSSWIRGGGGYMTHDAAIGGGGGTFRGGDGGTITISGGTIYASSSLFIPYDTSYSTYKYPDGAVVGSAAIGGGNGGDSGNISVTGGDLRLGIRIDSASDPATPNALPAVIGAGAGGNVGNIELTGGNIRFQFWNDVFKLYDKSPLIGVGKGGSHTGNIVVRDVVIDYPYIEKENDPKQVRLFSSNLVNQENESVYPINISIAGIRGNAAFWNTLQGDEEPRVVTSVLKKGAENASYSLNGMGVRNSWIWHPLAAETMAEIDTAGDSGLKVYDLDLTYQDAAGYDYIFKGSEDNGGVYYKKQGDSYIGRVKAELTGGTNPANGYYTDQTMRNEDGSISGEPKPGEVGYWVYNNQNKITGWILKTGESAVPCTVKTEYRGINRDEYIPLSHNEILHAGNYRVTIASTENPEIKLVRHYYVSPKRLELNYTGGAIEKEYDRAIAYNGTVLFELKDPSQVCSGDSLSEIRLIGLSFPRNNVGTYDSLYFPDSYLYKNNGVDSEYQDYAFVTPEIPGKITEKIIKASDANTKVHYFVKKYDGNTTFNGRSLRLGPSVNPNESYEVGLFTNPFFVNDEIGLTWSDGSYDSPEAGKRTVTLHINGVKSENYALENGGFDLPVRAEILPADYTYTLGVHAEQTLEGQVQLTDIQAPNTAEGIPGETVRGTLSFWQEEACENELTQDALSSLSSGEHEIYVRFMPLDSETNYVQRHTVLPITLKLKVETNQELTWAQDGQINATYGETGISNLATNASDGGGSIEYSSSETSVAEVGTAGRLDIKGVGRTTIKATAAAVANKYNETSIEYELVVSPAAYTYQLSSAQSSQEISKGAGLNQISLPKTANGVLSETVRGTVVLYTDEDCQTEAQDSDISGLDAGATKTLWAKFTPDSGQDNYVTKATVVSLEIRIVEGAAQEISWAQGEEYTVTYGDAPVSNAATNNSADGGTLVGYRSEDPAVATVDTDGALEIVGAGRTTITATFAAVDGQYRQTSSSYTLIVNPKTIIATIENKTKKFGEENPEFTFTLPDGALVGSDDKDSLGITLSSSANVNTPVGTAEITGTENSSNYQVEFTQGTLTIEKADAPTLQDITVNLPAGVAQQNYKVKIKGMPKNAGNIVFKATIENNPDNVAESVSGDAGGILLNTHASDAGKVASIVVTVESENYQSAQVKVNLHVVEKAELTIENIRVPNKVYDGQRAALEETPTATGYTGDFVYLWEKKQDGVYAALTDAPKDAGEYRLKVSIPAESEYQGETFAEFTISPKALTIKPANMEIKVGEELPVIAAGLIFEGLISGDNVDFSIPPTFALQKQDGSPLTDSNTSGEFVVKWTNADVCGCTNANYVITKSAEGVLGIHPASGSSSGGGSGSGGSTGGSSGSESGGTTGGSTGGSTGGGSSSGGGFTGGGSGSGGGSGAVVTPNPTPTPNPVDEVIVKAPEIKKEGETTVAVLKVETKSINEKVQAKIDDKSVLEALKAMENQIASDQKTNENVGTEAEESKSSGIEIKLEVPKNAKAVELSLSKEVVKAVADSAAQGLTMSSKLSQVTMSKETLASISNQAGGDVVLQVAKAEQLLNEKQKEAVGDAPVYDISITSGKKKIRTFDGGLLTIELPYELKAGEDPSGVVVWYVDDLGNIQKMKSMYNVRTRKVAFTTNHLSKYAVAYDIDSAEWKNPYSDVESGHWFYDAVRFAAKKNLMTGVASDEFAPSMKTDRAMLVTILYRMDGSPEADFSNPFTDVESDKYYTKAVLWAADRKIVNGVGDGIFAPEKPITREELTVILRNYAKYKQHNLSSGADISGFGDVDSVSAWALDAVKWAHGAGIINGRSSAVLDPQGHATRAELSAMLMNFFNSYGEKTFVKN